MTVQSAICLSPACTVILVTVCFFCCFRFVCICACIAVFVCCFRLSANKDLYIMTADCATGAKSVIYMIVSSVSLSLLAYCTNFTGILCISYKWQRASYKSRIAPSHKNHAPPRGNDVRTLSQFRIFAGWSTYRIRYTRCGALSDSVISRCPDPRPHRSDPSKRAKSTRTPPACRSLRNRIIGWAGRPAQAAL